MGSCRGHDVFQSLLDESPLRFRICIIRRIMMRLGTLNSTADAEDDMVVVC
jgi:hypothetical protein